MAKTLICADGRRSAWQEGVLLAGGKSDALLSEK